VPDMKGLVEACSWCEEDSHIDLPVDDLAMATPGNIACGSISMRILSFPLPNMLHHTSGLNTDQWSVWQCRCMADLAAREVAVSVHCLARFTPLHSTSVIQVIHLSLPNIFHAQQVDHVDTLCSIRGCTSTLRQKKDDQGMPKKTWHSPENQRVGCCPPSLVDSVTASSSQLHRKAVNLSNWVDIIQQISHEALLAIILLPANDVSSEKYSRV